MNNLLQLYVVYHKETPIIRSDIFIPIQGGRSISDLQLEMIGDDTGLNISHKNNIFCELTVLYWMRHNAPASEFIGLNHYRRFFYLGWNDKINQRLVIDQNLPLFQLNFEQGLAVNLQSQILFERILANCDIILPIPQNFSWHFSLREQYGVSHGFHSFREMLEVLIDLHPAKANQIYSIADSLLFYPCNMFIMRRSLFETYADWLFNVIEKLEHRVLITDRLIGFLGERLFNFYIQLFLSNGKYKIKQFPIMFLSD